MSAADWSRLSPQQLRCVDALDFAPPLHETHLRKRHKVRGTTITSCINRGLVRRDFLRGDSDAYSMPFLRLTQLGLEYQRDWRRWRNRVATETAAATGASIEDAVSVFDGFMLITP